MNKLKLILIMGAVVLAGANAVIFAESAYNNSKQPIKTCESGLYTNIEDGVEVITYIPAFDTCSTEKLSEE